MRVSDDWKKTVRLNKLLGMWPPKNWESRAGTLTPIRVAEGPGRHKTMTLPTHEFIRRFLS
jgi:hypothetical protein